MVDVAKGEGDLIPIARDDEGWAIPGWAGAGAVAVDVAVVGAVAWAGVVNCAPTGISQYA